MKVPNLDWSNWDWYEIVVYGMFVLIALPAIVLFSLMFLRIMLAYWTVETVSEATVRRRYGGS